MKVVGIYKITSPSGKVYIGQSVDIEKRFKTYLRCSCKHCCLLDYGLTSGGQLHAYFDNETVTI